MAEHKDRGEEHVERATRKSDDVRDPYDADGVYQEEVQDNNDDDDSDDSSPLLDAIDDTAKIAGVFGIEDHVSRFMIAAQVDHEKAEESAGIPPPPAPLGHRAQLGYDPPEPSPLRIILTAISSSPMTSSPRMSGGGISPLTPPRITLTGASTPSLLSPLRMPRLAMAIPTTPTRFLQRSDTTVSPESDSASYSTPGLTSRAETAGGKSSSRDRPGRAKVKMNSDFYGGTNMSFCINRDSEGRGRCRQYRKSCWPDFALGSLLPE
ncbi:uncharacterized protein BCR38DRAFT_407372 [Pseudomassariella vexata]|uniref:Uncharacterized protein n=1 Tax=Pseudomassariella vexata TaxID=1141098 RepID=A0A1Y2E741_9PEZI|nr:uncharacterized protein BCR38DRAFT_407372 [Pseudomassariella vexata]ORY67393.1 hypothetical protein BCR38DRAFT_407372 [Pseudomassariella vexata]